jgi:histidinol-phosphate aminotransferase
MTYGPAAQAEGLRLHLNENTAGCSAEAIEALRALTREAIGRYPDDGAATRDAERWFDVGPGWVQLLNGLDEGLQVVALRASVLSRTSFEGIVVEPAFEMYRSCIEATGGRAVAVPSGAGFAFPLDRVLASITERTRVIYLCDPNNPTGRPMPAGAIETIAGAAPDALVLADEAYAEFTGRTLIGPALGRHRNVVVGRTFAKAYGLAGLRIGALVAHPDTLGPLRRFLLPYAVNVAATTVLRAALRSREHIDRYVAESAASRRLIAEFCVRAGLTSFESAANFVLVRVGSQAAAVVAALAARGVIIRDRSADRGCEGCVRITAGLIADTERCLALLEDCLAPRQNRPPHL